MRKLFYTICFISFIANPSYIFAAVRSVGSPMELEELKFKKETSNTRIERPADPVFNTQEELFEYIKERRKIAVLTEIPPEEVNNIVTMDVVPSDDEIEASEMQKTNYFQKVFEDAIARASKQKNEHKDIRETTSGSANKNEIETQQKQWQEPNYQSVNATLPSGRKILVPAIEHIAYLMSDIELLPNGAAKIGEKIVVVANGEKLANGLSKALPKTSTSRSGKTTKLDISLISVKINGKEVEYKIEEFGNLVVLSPKVKYILEPGVYTYDFEYVVDRQLWEYDDFNEFFWNITGDNWNLIIARVASVLRMPGTEPDLTRSAFINNNGALDLKNANVVRVDNNTLGFSSTKPIFAGESFQFLVSMPSKNFIPLDIDKKIYLMIDDYGDIILSVLGLLAIVGAYFVSWIFITENKSKQKYFIQRTGPISRYLIKGGFDKISFGAFFLELYKKKIIDLRQEGDKLSIIKLTDNLSSLSKDERKSLNNMFLNKESVLRIEKENILKLNRAYKFIERDIKEKIRKFLVKINLGYITFSVAMLMLVQLGIAMLGYSPITNMLTMVGSDMVFAVAIAMLLKKFSNSIIGYILKGISLFLIALALLVLVSTISVASGFVTLLIIYTIFAYTNIFSNRNGLIKNNIREARNSADYISKNIEEICSPRNFSIQQPNIFAAEQNGKFREKMSDKEYYKLDIVENIIAQM